MQLLVALGILFGARGGFNLRWPLVTADQLTGRRFTWTNLILFLAGNIFVVPLLVAFYLAFCAAQAVGHFSQGFVALRPGGVTVQVREYARTDGKRIRLVPMAHVGDAEFYRAVSRSFPTNSTILMEGVTDNQNLLTNKISYKRMASSLGLSEQQREFKPQGEMVHADVDVEVFSRSTIGMLNLIMLVHRDGLTLANLLMLMQCSPPPEVQAQVWEDLLHKRNRHLLEEIETRLPDTGQLMIPWGAAHMPEISQGIQKSGFHLVETREYTVIQFFGGTSEPQRTSPNPNASH